MTSTLRPARASSRAATAPPAPDPMTTTSTLALNGAACSRPRTTSRVIFHVSLGEPQVSLALARVTDLAELAFVFVEQHRHQRLVGNHQQRQLRDLGRLETLEMVNAILA